MNNDCFVVALVSGKGGTGKTTLTANFAVELASASRIRGDEGLESKNRVLVIDNDYATGGASYLLAGGERLRAGAESDLIKPSSCFYDCYSSRIPAKEVTPLRLLFEEKSVGEFQIDVLLNSLAWWKTPLPSMVDEQEPPDIELEATAEGFIDRNLLPYYEGLMERFRQEYDYIIIDSRGGADTRASVAAVIADSIIIVTEPGDVAGKQDMSFVQSLRHLAKQIERKVGAVSVIYNRVLDSERESKKGRRDNDLTVIGRLPISETVVSCYRNTELVFERKPLDPFCIEAVKAFEARFPGEQGICQTRRRQAKALLKIRTIASQSSTVLQRAVVVLSLILGLGLLLLAGGAGGAGWWFGLAIPLVLAAGGIVVCSGIRNAVETDFPNRRYAWIGLSVAALVFSIFLAIRLGLGISGLADRLTTGSEPGPVIERVEPSPIES